MKVIWPALALILMVSPFAPLHAQTTDDPYNIMKPEPGRRSELPTPGIPPKYKSPRGTQQHVTRPRTTPPVQQAYPQTPPPIYVPQTGRLVPNLPSLPGSGPGGSETGQDKAMRCAHQAGAAGEAAGNPAAYLGSCVNQ